MNRQATDCGKSSYYLGRVGPWIPMITFLLLALIFVVSGFANVKSFWIPAVVGIAMNLLLLKEKKCFGNICIHAVTDRTCATCILVFLFAGILSSFLRSSGLVAGLLDLCTRISVSASFIPAAVFIICVVISTACGTTSGTVSAAVPILFPVAVSLGCNPAIIMGAIISGGFFGDNLSPISDTTILSTNMFDVPLIDAVKARLKYSAITAALAVALYGAAGFLQPPVTVHTVTGGDGNALSLIMLVVPVLLIVAMSFSMDVLSALVLCNVCALVLCVVFGLMPLQTIVSANSPIINGMESMTGVIVLIIMISINMRFLLTSGVFESLNAFFDRWNRTKKSAALLAALINVVSMCMISSNTAAMITTGPIIRKITDKNGVDRIHSANAFDGIACGIAGLLPYNPSMLLMCSLALETGLLDKDFSFVSIVPFSFHCILLVVVYTGSIFVKYGRTAECDAMRAGK